jgi:hypothetical protein
LSVSLEPRKTLAVVGVRRTITLQKSRRRGRRRYLRSERWHPVNAQLLRQDLQACALAHSMIMELPAYQQACQSLHAVDPLLTLEDMLAFWKGTRTNLKAWAKFTRRVLLYQPSSATVERVLSLLEAKFNSQQRHTSQDYVCQSVAL